MKQIDQLKNRVLAAVLMIAALAAGQSAWAQVGTFTVQNTSGSTFTITRTSNTDATEKVMYRTVSLSAIAGTHFTAASGTLTFDAENNTRTVTVTESGSAANAYKYHIGSASRQYRFEVTDLGGAYLAHCDRSITSGLTQFSGAKVSSSISNLVTMSSGNFSSGMSSGKYLDVNFTPASGNVETSGTLSGYVLIDDSYDYAQKPATVSTSSLISSTGAPANYLSTLGYKIYATVCFTEKERDDGYQYLQIVAGNSSASYDTGADKNSQVYDPVNSVYKVCFEFADGSNAEGKIYFPHRGTTSSEFSNSNGKLHQQKYKSDNNWIYDGSGAVVLPVTTGSITTRFDAGGDNDDTWGYKDFFVRMALQDGTAPAIAGDPVVSPGPYGAGTTVYISVPFSEIVTVTGTPYIHTDWGDYNYLSGSGSNVLTFSGTIPATFGASLITRNLSGTIKDLAGNALSGTSCYKYFSSITVALPWGGSGSESDPYVISTANQLNFMATRVNANTGNDNFSGKYFVLAADITYTHTTDWNTFSGASSTTENNFTPIGVYGRSFQGHFDGQGHAISGIRVNKSHTATDNTNESLGLFGFVSGGSVSNVVLRDANIRGLKNMGGIVGYLSSGSVTGCTLYQVLVGSHAKANQATGMGIVVGNIQGSGTVTDCYYRDCVKGLTYQDGHNDITIAPHPERWDNVYDITTATGVSATYESGTTITIDAATYYAEGCTFNLAYSGTLQAGSVQDGYTNTYTTTPDHYTFIIHHDHITDATLTVPAADCSVSVRWTSAWEGSGTSETPYLITTTDQLDLLAKMVNGQGGYGYSDFSGTYFKLGNDITYTHTTDWNDAASTENNYTAIGGWRSGTTYNQFNGTFDGDGHTISGIRIYKGDSGDSQSNQGLFGFIGTGGTVHDLTLADTRITGNVNVGGIAGINKGTIQNCTISANVLVAASASGGNQHGGIVGRNSGGTVTGCTVSAKLASTSAGSKYYGVVAGINNIGSTIENCLALGAHVPALVKYYGIITGENDSNGTSTGTGILTANYYLGCNVGINENVVNKGVGTNNGSTDKNGARSVHSLTLGDDVTATPGTLESVTISGNLYYTAGSTFTLAYTGTPATGHRFTGFNATAGTVSGDLTNGYTFTMLAADATVSARIEEVAYTISYNLDGGEFSGDYPTGYNVTTPTFTLPAPTRTGYTFAGWTGTGLDAAIMSVTITEGSTGDRTYTATWTAIDYTVSPQGGNWNFSNGTVIPDNTGTAHYGDVVTFAVTPANGYMLKTLTVTNLTTSEATNITADANGHYTFTMPASNVDLYAEFAESHIVIIDAGIEHGTVTASPTVAYEGQTVTLTVTPDAGYELALLDVNGNGLGQNTSFEMPHDNVTVTATFTMTWASLNAAMQNGGSFTLPYDITAVNGDGPLIVPSDKTVTLDLNGHTLYRNLTAATANGSAIKVFGTLTLNDGSASGTGTITGGKSTNTGGGVDVNGGTFTMNGGTITGNTTKYDGGGVLLNNNSTFTMNGGSISNNATGNSGGGVFISNNCVFTMTGGTITGNSAVTYAGGVFVRGSGSFNVSDSPVISGNTLGGNANNAHLRFSSSIITVTGELTNAAHIGVTTSVTPTVSDPVVITDGLSGNGTVANFTSDNGSNIALSGGEAALLATHSVTFLCGNGSGTMEPAHIEANTDYTIPACGFTAPEGMMFVGWVSNNGWTLRPGEELYMDVDYTLTAVFHTYHTVTITGDGANGIETEWYWNDAQNNSFYGYGYGSGIRFPEGANLDFHDLPFFISSTPALNFNESSMTYSLDNVTTDVSISLSAAYAINLTGSGYEEGLHAYARSVADDRFIITSAPAGAVVYLIGTMDGGAGSVKSCTVTGQNTSKSYDVTVEDYGWAAIGCGFTMPEEPVDAHLVIGYVNEINIYCEHGNVTTTANSLALSGTAFEGDIVTLTVTPDPGYALESLTVTYEDYNNDTHTVTTTQGTGANANQYTFTMPDERVDVSATFAWVNPMELHDNADNTALIAAANGMTGLDVKLTGRTLYKDGNWNTLCLPFNLTISGSVLDGDNVDVRTLSSTDFDSSTGVLTLNFTAEGNVTELVAGTPYIIKWASSDNLVSPTFTGVTVINAANDVVTDYVDFCGTYASTTFTSENKSILFLGTEDKLYWPQSGAHIGPCRAYFQLNSGITAGDPAGPNAVRAFNLNFGDGDATGIVDEEANSSLSTIHSSLSEWYTLDGRKLAGKPTAKGLYINNGKKIVIK